MSIFNLFDPLSDEWYFYLTLEYWTHETAKAVATGEFGLDEASANISAALEIAKKAAKEHKVPADLQEFLHDDGEGARDG